MLMEKIEELYLKDILKVYRDNAEKFFSTHIMTNPEAFPMLKSEHIILYSVKFDEEYFKNCFIDIFIVKHKNGNQKFIEHIITDKCYYSKFDPLKNSNKNKINILSHFLNIDPRDVIQTINMDQMTYRSFMKYDKEILRIQHANINDETMRWLREEAISYQKHVNQPMEYYAKNASRFSYSLLDLTPILEKINDEDFSYQMDQAIAAYDNSLYLASCATLGVALETLCKLLLIKEGVKVKDSDGTMLDKLGERLKEKGIISYKFKHRIDVCYKVRNIASHTSPGKVVQNDCHFILNTIHEIVDIYFK